MANNVIVFINIIIYKNKEFMSIENYLEGWVFAYNPYTGKYMATTRDNYNNLFNNYQSESVLKSSKFETLRSLIIKMKGNPKSNFIKNL